MLGADGKEYSFGSQFTAQGALILPDGTSQAISTDGRPAYQSALGNRVLLLGDSITYQGAGPGTASNPFGYVENGWFVHLNRRAGGRLDYIKNAAITGRTSADVLAALAIDIAGVTFDGVFLLIGTNDFQNGVSTATTISNVTSIVKSLLNLGKWVGFAIPPPRSWNLPTEAAKLTLQLNGNRWLRQFIASTPGAFLLADGYATLVDPISATGAWLTSNDRSQETSIPYLHPNNLGAWYLAEQALPVILSKFPSRQVLPDSVLRVYANNTRFTQDDPLSQATTVAPGTGGTSGLIPTGWTFNGSPTGGTVACAVVANASGIGNDIELTITASGAGGLSFSPPTGAATNINARLDTFNGAAYQFQCGGWSKVVSGASILRTYWGTQNGVAPILPDGQMFGGGGCASSGNAKAIPGFAGQEFTDVLPRVYCPAGTVWNLGYFRMQFACDWSAAGTFVVRVGRPFLDVIQPAEYR